jgi:acyl-CoA hydrolase/RimJ/RimL family protein N-acetyltransferase
MSEQPPHPALSSLRHKIISADDAARMVRPGDHVFIGTACASPRSIVGALEALPGPPSDVEFVHFITTQVIPHADRQAVTRYRHRTFFVGTDVRAAVRQGLAEYVPISIAQVPRMMELGRIPIDVALIQVSLPDQFGYVSLGVSVDIIPAALAAAKLVIAEVNPAMPSTMGDSMVHVSQIHKLVPVDTPVTEYVHAFPREEVVEHIARYIAGIIDDGSTLQIGPGRIPNAALGHLEDRRDLGIHSDVITDSIIPLMEKGILTGRLKTENRGKIVASVALGTRRLYDIINRNPLFSFQPIDVICGPGTIAAQRKMVSVTQAFAVDLTGQVCSDQFEGRFYGGVAAQADFLRGAGRSVGGKPIICLTSTTEDGKTSRIRSVLLAGEGVSVARSDVHYVITEYGIAYLFGKSIRERAIALIQIAHPGFRSALLEEAKQLGYVPPDQMLENLSAYPVEDERAVTLRHGRRVMLRPATASDAAGIRNLFHHLTDEDIYTRFFRRVQGLSNRDIQRLCNLNYETEVAFVAATGPRENQEIVGHACYFVNPSTNLGETAFMIAPEWQSTGLGKAMQRHMVDHAMARGLRGFVAEALAKNKKMVSLARSCSEKVSMEKDQDTFHITMLF